MKKRIKLIVPIPMNEQTKAMFTSQLPPEIICPEIEVEFGGAGSWHEGRRAGL